MIDTLTPHQRYEHQLQSLARAAMDKLYEEMRKRGVTTTMMYDFGIPAVVEALRSAPAKPVGYHDVERYYED